MRPPSDDLTLYRDVTLVRQRFELDGATATVHVPGGVTADRVFVIEGHASVRSGALGELLLDFGSPGHHAIVLSYITDAIHWDATYTITANAAHDHAVLHGELALRNTSEVTLRGAARLIDVELGTSAKPPAVPATGRELGAITLAPGETKRTLVEGQPRTMRAVLVYDPIGTKLDNTGAVPLRDPSLGLTEPVSPNVSESVEIARDRREAADLPAGPVRLLERRANGTIVPLAEARLFDPATRSADVDTIPLGAAEGVTGKRERRELTDEESRHRIVEEFVIEIDNARPRPIDILVREHLYRGQTWAVAYQSVPDVHQDGPQAFTMRTHVPARGQVKILYVVVYTWGT